MPWWASRSDMRTVTEFMYVLALAQMWNLLAGYGGMLSVGQQGFIGLGGYFLVILSLKMGINPFVAVFLCGIRGTRRTGQAAPCGIPPSGLV